MSSAKTLLPPNKDSESKDSSEETEAISSISNSEWWAESWSDQEISSSFILASSLTMCVFITLIACCCSVNKGFNRSRCFLNSGAVVFARASFEGAGKGTALIAVWSNTNTLHSGDCWTWFEKLFTLGKGFLVFLTFRLQHGLGQ